MTGNLGALVTLAAGERAVRNLLEVAATENVSMVVDSGAWSTFTGKANVTLEGHTEAVLRLQDEFPSARFIGLDVIGDGEQTLLNWKHQRACGARVEPTITFGETDEYAARVFAEYPDGWANFGGLVGFQKRPAALRQVAAWAAHIRRAMPDAVKVHALGATTPQLNDYISFDAVDSTYWKLPLLINRSLSLFDQRTRTWTRMPVPSRTARTLSVERSAVKHRELLAAYGVTVGEFIESTDRELLRLSALSQKRFTLAYRSRHPEREIVTYLAAVDKRDIQMIPEINGET